MCGLFSTIHNAKRSSFVRKCNAPDPRVTASRRCGFGQRGKRMCSSASKLVCKNGYRHCLSGRTYERASLLVLD